MNNQPQPSPEEAKQESSLNHIWHVWINRRQQEMREKTPDHEHEHTLYEFKSMLDFLRYGHVVIGEAFEDKLATSHQQCSRSLPVPILNNTLRCALGTNVTDCAILLSLKATFDEEKARTYPFNGKPAYPHLPGESLYLLMAKTCAWHILSKSTRMQEGWGGVDTSEGWVMDESDRMFWSNVYESLGGNS